MKQNRHNLWKRKIEPRVRARKGNAGGEFVVKTLDPHENVHNLLPYYNDLIEASPAIDIWSFGVLLYNLCTEQSLLPVDRADDLADAESMSKAATWTDNELERKIRCANIIGSDVVEAKVVKDLLCKLLRVNPQDRPKSMSDVLGDPLFRGIGSSSEEVQLAIKEIEKAKVDINEKQHVVLNAQSNTIKLQKSVKMEARQVKYDIHTLGTDIRLQVNTLQNVLLRGMYEATEITVPTCFTITSHKLKAIEKRVHSSDAENESNNNEIFSWLATLNSFVNNLYDMYQIVNTLSTMSPDITLNNLIGALFQTNIVYLYLVDEYTLEPVIPDEDSDGTYPIEIITASEFAPELTIVLETSWKAVMVAKGVVGLARCLGLPSKDIPDELCDILENVAESVRKRSYSSVSEYEKIDAVVMKLKEDSGKKFTVEEADTKSATQSVRGYSLREFERFLLKKDSNKDFCGLSRVVLDDHKVCWTMQSQVESFEASFGLDSHSSPTRRMLADELVKLVAMENEGSILPEVQSIVDSALL
jgi:hypothetical protein